MSTNPTKEADDPLIDLFRAVEDALAIVGDKAVSELNLTLESVELETSLLVSRSAAGGFKIEAIGFDASARSTSEHTHRYRLKLRRRPSRAAQLGADKIEVANAIFAMLSATRQVSTRALDFYVDTATLTLDLVHSKEGVLRVVAGGEGKSGSGCTVTLTFAVREM